MCDWWPASLPYKMIKYVKLHSFYKIKCAGIIHCAPAWIAQNTVYLGVRLRSRGLSKLHYPAPASSSQLYVTHFAARDSWTRAASRHADDLWQNPALLPPLYRYFQSWLSPFLWNVLKYPVIVVWRGRNLFLEGGCDPVRLFADQPEDYCKWNIETQYWWTVMSKMADPKACRFF